MEERAKINELKVAPCILYPTETIAAIDDKRVRECYEAYASEKGQLQEIFVLCYKDCLYIYEGHEQVLAAIQFGIKEIKVTEINRNFLSFWADDNAFTGTLQDIGMTALYDFEAVGGFRYESYPSYYHGDD